MILDFKEECMGNRYCIGFYYLYIQDPLYTSIYNSCFLWDIGDARYTHDFNIAQL